MLRFRMHFPTRHSHVSWASCFDIAMAKIRRRVTSYSTGRDVIPGMMRMRAVVKCDGQGGFTLMAFAREEGITCDSVGGQSPASTSVAS